jgi:E3 ubiquitin-protein ligase RNF14
MADTDERAEELDTLVAIYPEITLDSGDAFTATLELPVVPSNPLLVRFLPTSSTTNGHEPTRYASVTTAAYIEHDVAFSHLPPLTLHLKLPATYPAEIPPTIRLSSHLDWLPKEKLAELEGEAANLWEEYGRCQILYIYIDYLQQAAERGFDLDEGQEGCMVLSVTQESGLVEFDNRATQESFDAGTYDCGICLDPKKGSKCYRMKRCSHVFCRSCLQDVYNNAIKEGDVAQVKCLEPGCAAETVDANGQKRKRRTERTVHPRELLDMGVEESVVRRYVEMKRKKKLEADKTTIWCPREWCQGPAKNPKHRPIPADLRQYIADEIASDDEGDIENGRQQLDANPTLPPTNKGNIPPDPNDRLAVCEKCSYAFCKVCYLGWHGPFARCYPRDPSELSAEEKASYDYIRMNTSPCPYCNAPVQKTMGCNHMNCFNCSTHFCYLCGSWLDGQNPYQHFNKGGSSCFQRLWELEEGDEGQGPEDGRGFGGGRAWEQLAIEAARAADEAEAEEAAARAQAEENERAVPLFPAAPEPPQQQVPLVVAMGQLQMDEVIDPPIVAQRGGRRQRMPHPGPPAGRGAAQAVRNHERGRGRGRGGRGAGGGRGRPQLAQPAGNGQDIQDWEQRELARFLEMARDDEEDGWDSDELGDDDERFVIPPR